MVAPPPTSVLPLAGAIELSSHPIDERLADRVLAYWSLGVERPPARVRVIPDGLVDLVFDLDTAEAHVAGVARDPFEATHVRVTHLLGVALRPGAAAPLLGVPVGALDTGWQPLAALVGEVATALAARLRDLPGIEPRLALLESFLLARLGGVDPRVTRALDAIAASDGDIGVARLGRHSGASPRNLHRLFHEWVGVAHKRFARIVRAQAALRRLRQRPPPDLASLAIELGFSDQAHLSRELRALTGLPPTQLAETFKRTTDSYKP